MATPAEQEANPAPEQALPSVEETSPEAADASVRAQENGDVMENPTLTVARASETSAASASTTNLLGGVGCGDGTSIRSMLCAVPDQVEINDDIDEAQKAFLDVFTKQAEEEEIDDGTLDEVTADSDLSTPDRRIWVVTTATLPWRTGTAVNPLLRALYLTRGRPKHHVTLVIPWLEDVASRIKLYGPQNSFAAGGQQEQEAWIRKYCRERAHCEEEEANMNILFYSAVYQKSFGSIFPTVDICSLIPDNEADIAILDEPEHLNWFRAPPPKKEEKKQVVEEMKAEGDDACNDEIPKNDSIATAISREKAEFGWAFKFRHIVGILHTNYSAYMSQYAIGTAIIAAPAIGMLSSIVVRAYCHRVIRLSAVLPTLAPNKEVTCNVHGVRSEFLEPSEREEEPPITDDDDMPPASIYFIGKIMWAKGFDKVLEIQDYFRKGTGNYFPIDIYGSGPDEKEIKRAFYGRSGKPPKKSATPPIEPSLSEEDIQAAEIFAAETSLREQVDPLQVDTAAVAIEVVPDPSSPLGDSVHVSDSSDSSDLAIESAEMVDVQAYEEDEAEQEEEEAGEEEEEEHEEEEVDEEEEAEKEEQKVEQEKEDDEKKRNPLSVIGDLSSNSVATAKATSQAVYALGDSIVKAGMKMTMTWEKTRSAENSDTEEGEEKKTDNNGKRFSYFDPPKTTYEWRRTPIPARFLGVRDHAELRDISQYKVFLNASVTEVLCTTTAEALAMGKFAVIPKHVSNEFFYQFPNCLTFETPAECVEKLEWALANTPTPLSDDDRHTFTWEAATERLVASSAITKREMRERERNGTNKADARIAWLHFESGRTRHRIGRLLSSPFSRHGSFVSSESKNDDEADAST